MMDRPFKTIYVMPGQSIFDIAIQEYKVVEGVILILEANPGLNITDVLVPGRALIIWTEESVKLINEIITNEPYASSLQGLLMQWNTLVGTTIYNNIFDTSNILEIPKLQLVKRNGHLYARWSSSNTKFLDFNPKIRLFRYSKSSAINQKDDLSRPVYYLRSKSLKWRMMTKFKDDVIKKIEFNCPVNAHTEQLIDIDLEEWIETIYDGSTPPRIGYVRMSRKSRGKIILMRDPSNASPGSAPSISVGFGIAIVIDNPVTGQSPKKIWNEISKFKISAIRHTFKNVNDEYEWTIRKTITLR